MSYRMKEKSGITVKEICLTALAVCINIAGGQIALVFRLPIYLDSIGTILIGVLLGPFYGMIPNLLSGIVMGMTMDIYSLYFAPVGMVTGFMAGLVSGAVRGRTAACFPEPEAGSRISEDRTDGRAPGTGTGARVPKPESNGLRFPRKGAILLAAVAVTVPGSLLSAWICAALFGGITSSGSSILVQLLSHTSLNMTASVFLVQILTDYLDRAVSLYLVAGLMRVMPTEFRDMRRKTKKAERSRSIGNTGGTLQ